MGTVIDLLPYLEKKKEVKSLPDEFYFYLNEEDQVWIADVNGVPTYYADSFEQLMENSGWDYSSSFEFGEDENVEYEEM